MPEPWIVAAVVYVAGALVTLAAVDDTPRTRAALAVLWPAGPLAFVLVVAILLLALPVALPRAAAVLGAAGAAIWLLVR